MKIALLFGGQSTEHEVSLQSAQNICQAIDRERFDVLLIGIDKQGKWHISDENNYLSNPDNPTRIALKQSEEGLAVIPGSPFRQLLHAKTGNPLAQVDVVFPIVHGTFGEDGSLQGLLRMANLPFVGCSVIGSAICMDKDVAKRLLREAGFNVTPFVTLTRKAREKIDFNQVKDILGLPLFVKPANQGSSVGVSQINNIDEYESALDLAFQFDHKVLVEKSIVGREIECAVLGNENPEASICGEIIVRQDAFYSYNAKYINEYGAVIAVPADIPADIHRHIQAIAVKAFKTLECSGMARVDFFLTPDNEIIVNELNTLPGFTNISVYPKLWEASGLTYQDLINKLIDLAIARHHQELSLTTSVT